MICDVFFNVGSFVKRFCESLDLVFGLIVFEFFF